MITVVSRLRETIKAKCFIQSALAKRAEIAPAKLSLILNSKRRLTVEEFLRLCAVLEISPDEMAQSTNYGFSGFNRGLCGARRF